jgi:hypothetical protein
MNLEWSYIPWGIGILIAFYFLYRALKRIIKGIISYKTLGKKEFKKRLSKGFDEITATQKTKGEIISIIISQIGLSLGLILVPIFRIEGLWIAIELTFLGGFGINLFALIGKLQQYRVFKKQDELMKELEKENYYTEREEQDENS